MKKTSASKPAAVAIHWTADEYIHVLGNMRLYWERNGHLPAARAQKELYAQFMLLMPKARQRPVHPTYVSMIRRVFHLWLENPAVEHWYAHTSLSSRVSASTAKESILVQTQALPPAALVKEKKVCVRKPLQAKASPLPSPLAVTQQTQPAADSVDKLSAFAEQSKALFKEMESTFVARLTPLFALSPVTQAMEAAPAPLEAKVEPSPAPTTPHPQLFPVLSVKRKMPEPVVPTVPVPVALTEADVRRIVREEIEAIFGTTTSKPAPLPEKESIVVLENEPLEKPAPFVYIKSEAPALPALEVNPEKLRILVFGLKAVQLAALTSKVPEHVTIVGVDSLGQAKDLAKNADHVIVSRFAGHSVFMTLRNAIGGKALFASGGTSMIKGIILNLIKTEKKQTALAE